MVFPDKSKKSRGRYPASAKKMLQGCLVRVFFFVAIGVKKKIGSRENFMLILLGIQQNALQEMRQHSSYHSIIQRFSMEERNLSEVHLGIMTKKTTNQAFL